MTDARFLINSVTCEANHVKCKTLMQDSLEIGQRVRPCAATLYKKSGNFQILGLRSNARAPIGVKFRTTKRTYVPLGCAKFHVDLQRIAIAGRKC